MPEPIEPDWKLKKVGCNDEYEWVEGDEERKVDLTRQPLPEPEKVAVVVRP